MSDSDPEIHYSKVVPDDKVLENTLRNTVSKIFKTGNVEELTVKRVRLATEKALGLQDGFFKDGENRKRWSAQIIKNEVELQENRAHQKVQEREVARKHVCQSVEPTMTKRKSTPGSHGARKKRRKSNRSQSEELSSPPREESGLENEDEKNTTIRKRLLKRPKGSIEPANIGSDSSVSVDKSNPSFISASNKNEEPEELSDSGMSVLIDEGPTPKRKKTQTSSKASREKPKRKTFGKSKEDTNLDPDQAEIKRLQGWLIKCGIRKMWFRELAPFDSPKAKINHLKKLLTAAGMEGRYSLQKANRIREERELKADLDMVQEEARKWGTPDTLEDKSQGGRSNRRFAKGFKRFDFLAQEDEESE